MSQISLETIEDVRKVIAKLPKEDLIRIDEEIHRYLETFTMMGASETGFSEWTEPEEDIYNNDV